MNSKIILLLGGLLSSLVVYVCFHKKPQKIITKQKDVLTKEQKEQKVVMEEPTLYYMSKKPAVAKLNFVDKNLGDKLKVYSKRNNQISNIIYSESFKPARWSKLVSKSIDFFDKNNLKNLFIQAKGDKITIKANFKNKNLFDKFNILVRQNQGKNLNLTNLSKLENSVDISKIQKIINENLKLYPIYFAKSSSLITDDGKKNLEKIIETFLKYKDIRFNLVIEGHTDATGNERKNKILSQKRADSVKDYLLQNCYNINNIKSIGYGSSKPKYPNKKDPKNRRVEIIVQKGQKNGNI